MVSDSDSGSVSLDAATGDAYTVLLVLANSLVIQCFIVLAGR